MPASPDKFFMDVNKAVGAASYFVQVKLQYLWVFVRTPGEGNMGDMALYKVSGHIDGTAFQPNPYTERRSVGYGTLDGAPHPYPVHLMSEQRGC